MEKEWHAERNRLVLLVKTVFVQACYSSLSKISPTCSVQHRAAITKLYGNQRTSLKNLWELPSEDARNPVPTEVQAQKAQNQWRMNRFPPLPPPKKNLATNSKFQAS